jgi:hypothetical protein
MPSGATTTFRSVDTTNSASESGEPKAAGAMKTATVTAKTA